MNVNTQVATEVPQEIVVRFRQLTLERLLAVEHAWSLLAQGQGDAAVERELHRHVHTLKGDSRVVGFSDVNLLCQKLEDLLFFAAQRSYHVPDDVDVMVTMALQFITMLVRKKVGASLGGIDLAGFCRQLDDVLITSRATPLPRVEKLTERDDAAAKRDEGAPKLAVAATQVFVESLRASDAEAAARLRAVWTTLSHELRALEAVPLEGLLAPHVNAASALAAELQKTVVVEQHVSATRVSRGAAEAIGAAVLHALTNAVDHGIELPKDRFAVGKNPAGLVTVRAREVQHGVELKVEDDGAGVDLERVLARAKEERLLEGRFPTEEALLELLFHPGFSTRSAVTSSSGRGIGLDAVRAAMTRVGGSVRLSSARGRGTQLVLRVPQVVGAIPVVRFSVPGARFPFAVPATWSVSEGGLEPMDLLAQLHLGCGGGAHAEVVRSLQLQRGGMRLCVMAASSPVAATAERLCPTPEEEPLEVVAVAGVELLLVRPDLLGR